MTRTKVVEVAKCYLLVTLNVTLGSIFRTHPATKGKIGYRSGQLKQDRILIRPAKARYPISNTNPSQQMYELLPLDCLAMYQPVIKT
ncbi:polyphosphate kinase [Lasius niger]|uniref:Polyphosphate kinase n=1 Tax=Lasius niger TaxID=67767 RepID=A0A0J7MXM8_LASNI|nr:polyphosphate kinase [Lasius niger]